MTPTWILHDAQRGEFMTRSLGPHALALAAKTEDDVVLKNESRSFISLDIDVAGRHRAHRLELALSVQLVTH